MDVPLKIKRSFIGELGTSVLASVKISIVKVSVVVVVVVVVVIDMDDHNREAGNEDSMEAPHQRSLGHHN